MRQSEEQFLQQIAGRELRLGAQLSSQPLDQYQRGDERAQAALDLLTVRFHWT
jgi:hypothetical protein